MLRLRYLLNNPVVKVIIGCIVVVGIIYGYLLLLDKVVNG